MTMPARRDGAPHARPQSRPLPGLAIVILLFVATILFGWSGLGANDSIKYVSAALGWVETGPSLGADHWALRLPLVGPMAASFSLFGPGEAAAALPNILSAVALVVATFFFGRRHLGAAAGFAAAAFIATSAYFVAMQSEVSITGIEALFLVLSAWTFADALQQPAKLRGFAVAGALAGAAWLCREVALFLPVALTLVLLLRRPRPWPAIVALGIGFLGVVAIEMVAYGVLSGDPFYRYRIDLGHRGGNPYDDGAGAGAIGTLVRPLEYLLTATETTPFLLLAGAAFFDRRFRETLAAGPRRDAALIFGAGAAVGFFLVGYGMNLKSNDYHPMIAYAAFLALGAWCGRLIEDRRALGTAAIMAIIGLNAAATDFRSYDEYSEPRRLAQRLIGTDEVVATDHATALRTRTFLRLAGLSGREAARRVVSLRNQPGEPCGLVYAATPAGARPATDARPGWREVWRADPRRRRLTHRVLAALGLGAGPSQRLTEILGGAEPAILYDAGACQ